MSDSGKYTVIGSESDFLAAPDPTPNTDALSEVGLVPPPDLNEVNHRLEATGIITIGLGSPTTNPRAEEYANFPVNGNADQQTNGVKAATDSGSRVTEHSIWADDVECDLDNVFKRLEQLVHDKIHSGQIDEADAKNFYISMLDKALSAGERAFPTTIEKK